MKTINKTSLIYNKQKRLFVCINNRIAVYNCKNFEIIFDRVNLSIFFMKYSDSKSAFINGIGNSVKSYST